MERKKDIKTYKFRAGSGGSCLLSQHFRRLRQVDHEVQPKLSLLEIQKKLAGHGGMHL